MASRGDLNLRHSTTDPHPISRYLNKLPSLKYLRISNNKLVSSGIPAGVFNVSTLVELDLSFNKLQKIPEVNEMLEQLYLQANQISSQSPHPHLNLTLTFTSHTVTEHTLIRRFHLLSQSDLPDYTWSSIS